MARFLLLICAVTMAWAQDDLASDPQNVATLDALQSYAETPLCLRCASTSDLTRIPGISRATAARIRSVVDSVVTIDELSSMACLTTDQQLLLATTCTLHCTCTTWLHSGRLRLRGIWRGTRTPDWSARMDVATVLGRVGAVLRSTATGSITGGWAVVPLEPCVIAVGDVSMASGLGMVLGGGGGFGRSAYSRLANMNTTIQLRPYTSTWQEAMARGIALHVPSVSTALPVEVGLMYSPLGIGGTSGSVVLASARMSVSATAVGGVHLYHDHAHTMASVEGELQVDSWQLHAEAGVMDAAHYALQVVARKDLTVGALSAAVRWSDPDLRHPYAAAISQASVLGNEVGCMVGLHYRQDRWNLEASLDIHGRPSPSHAIPMPRRGVDAIVDGQVRLVRGVNLDARCRYEVDDVSTDSRMTRRHRTTIRLDLTAQVQPHVRMRVRSDVRRAAWENGEHHHGYLSYIEARWTWSAASNLTARYTTYWSTSVDVAPYAMEVPAAGIFTTVVGNGTGTRLLLAATWQPVPSVRCSLSTLLLHAELSAAAQLDIRI